MEIGKVKVLHAVPPLTLTDVRRDVVRAQCEGYTREPRVTLLIERDDRQWRT